MMPKIANTRIYLFILLVLCFLCQVGCSKGHKSGPISPAPNQSIANAEMGAERALWIGAHPDDENSSAALLARLNDRVGELYMVSMTRGENSNIVWSGLQRGSAIGTARDVLFGDSAALFQADGSRIGPFVNGPHTLAALDAMDPSDPFVGWDPSKTSDDVINKWMSEGDPLAYVVEVIRLYRPDIIASMDANCGVSGNPEHIAVARLIQDALPLAADPAQYVGLGPAWSVSHVIFSAHVIPGLVSCGYCSCESVPPPDSPQDINALEMSALHGETYFRVGCRVKKMYQNTMEEKGWSPATIDTDCATAESAAFSAFASGIEDYPIFEPYRVQSITP